MAGDTSVCAPGFEADLLLFKVDSVILEKDTALGKGKTTTRKYLINLKPLAGGALVTAGSWVWGL